MSNLTNQKVRQKIKPLRDKDHLLFIPILPCLITRKRGEGVQAHHLLRVPTNERGAAMKSGDDFLVPLWWEAHHALHNEGMDERDFLGQYGIYGPGIAALLYRLSGDETACLRAIEEMWEMAG